METMGLVLSCLVSLVFILYLTSKKKKTQLQKIFIIDIVLAFGACFFLLTQKYLCATSNIKPIIFEWFIYLFNAFLPVSIFFTGLIFANTKIEFKKRYLLLFIIPILTIILLWTNDFHHLLYEKYSTNMEEVVTGKFMPIYSGYAYILYIVGFVYLLKYSIKNSGIFSKQAILFIIAILIPVVVNILGAMQIVAMSIYVTPICFTATILLLAVAVFKFDFFNVTPIALQMVVDHISDSYVVLDEKNVITDFNKTFLSTFSLKSNNIRNVNIFEWDKIKYLDKIENALQKASITSKTISFEAHMDVINKYFIIEVSSIINNGLFLGTLILFKDVTQHEMDMKTIKDNQDMLIERERFASLGQMIGGIAHNLKTPIMSVAGATEALTDLIKEYDMSIGDEEVTIEDHHEIAKDMQEWVDKIKTHISYMSDVITAVKGQAISSNENVEIFTVDELLNRVSILMKHELSHSLIELKYNVSVDKNFTMRGNINALVQVIDNIISNAIQAYAGEPGGIIDFSVTESENKIIFSIRDYGCGMTKEIQEKLFKEMITTKGKNGTGLGLYMSYSNIKAKFNGNITFESQAGKGTTFNIEIPC